MRIEYSNRALSDIKIIAAASQAFGPKAAMKVERQLLRIIGNISRQFRFGVPVAGKPGIRVASLVRFPYRIFYRTLRDSVRILHIRHTSRQSWTPLDEAQA